jgi:CRISPR/Cas system-associated exonuclease Cas4 (RecB family)
MGKFNRDNVEKITKEIRAPLHKLADELEYMAEELNEIFQHLDHFYRNYEDCQMRATPEGNCTGCRFHNICDARDRLYEFKNIDFNWL